MRKCIWRMDTLEATITYSLVLQQAEQSREVILVQPKTPKAKLSPCVQAQAYRLSSLD